MPYYIYFIVPEPNSCYVTFGKTQSLGRRWTQYLTHCPDPKLVGLIKCESTFAMGTLELDIKHDPLKAFVYRKEWMHHTDEVKTFYQKHTNVNIDEVLTNEIHAQKAYDRKRNQNPEKKARKKNYNKTPEGKARTQQRYRSLTRNAPKQHRNHPERIRKHTTTRLGMTPEALMILIRWLARDGWNFSKIAKALKINRDTIRKYAKRAGVENPYPRKKSEKK